MTGVFLLITIFAGMLAFVVATYPVVLLVNKAIGSAWEREAESTKAALSARGAVSYAEDGVRLRKTSVGPMSFSRNWLSADLRADENALYVFQYHLTPFGKMRIGQPTIRVVGTRDAGGVGIRARMNDHPRYDGPHVDVPCDVTLGAITLRITASQQQALMDALHRIYS